MKLIEIAPASAASMLYVAEHLREADVLELKAAYGEGVDVLTRLVRSYRSSAEVWVGSVDGVPTAIFGYVKMAHVGVPWMVATDDFKKSARSSIRHWYPLLDHINQQCPILLNYVHAENGDAIRWLTYMGFNLLPSVPMGNSRFHPFVRTLHV